MNNYNTKTKKKKINEYQLYTHVTPHRFNITINVKLLNLLDLGCIWIAFLVIQDSSLNMKEKKKSINIIDSARQSREKVIIKLIPDEYNKILVDWSVLIIHYKYWTITIWMMIFERYICPQHIIHIVLLFIIWLKEKKIMRTVNLNLKDYFILWIPISLCINRLLSSN